MVKGKPKQATGSRVSISKAGPSKVSSLSSSPAPSSSSQKLSTPQSGPICCGCGIIVNDDTKALQCDRCTSPEIWKCAECLHLSGDMYDQLVIDSNLSLKWFCHTCEQVVMDKSHNTGSSQSEKLDHLLSVIEKLVSRHENIEKQLEAKCDIHVMKQLDMRIHCLEQKLQNFDDGKRELQQMHTQISELNSKLETVQFEVTSNEENTKWSDIVSQAVESKFETVSAGINMAEQSIEETRKKAQEIRDKEDRRNNVILYKVPECRPGNYEEVLKHDSEYFMEMSEEVFGLDVTREDLKKVYRIGKRGPEVRPLLIQLSSSMLKNHVMETSFRLSKSEKFRHVVISHDMTEQEREQCKRLVVEAKDRESREGSGEFIYRVRGQPGAMKIVKLKKRI